MALPATDLQVPVTSCVLGGKLPEMEAWRDITRMGVVFPEHILCPVNVGARALTSATSRVTMMLCCAPPRLDIDRTIEEAHPFQ